MEIRHENNTSNPYFKKKIYSSITFEYKYWKIVHILINKTCYAYPYCVGLRLEFFNYDA